jgi:chemotaxis receptor (MCP) glutamine deamidase CheD
MAGGAATLSDLCAADKKKVADLIKQVVELGADNDRLRAQLAARGGAAAEKDERLRQLADVNKSVVQQNAR